MLIDSGSMQTECKYKWRLLGGMLLMLLTAVARAEIKVAQVPIYLDYPLLNQLLVTQLFTREDKTREILNDPGGCSRVVLSDPNMGPEEDSLEISAKVDASLGLAMLGPCRSLLNWTGGAHFIVRPVLQADGRSIRLEPQKTWLVDAAGNKVLSGPVWEAANKNLQLLVRGFVLDLTPYFESLTAFLPEVLPSTSNAQLQAMVESLALGDMAVQPESLYLGIKFSVDVPEQAEGEVTALTEAELEQFEERWQMMDALLVGAVKQYASATSLQPLRSTLLEILLDSRYRLRDALTDDTSKAEDAVRHMFIESWQRLGPVVREIALEQTGQEHWLWLTVLSATDALNALDQMGPAIGLDISTSGLRRLARMINADQADSLLRYNEEIDPQLQQLWQEEVQPPAPDPEASNFNIFIFPRAHAASTDKLKLWAPDRDELDTYLPLVDSLLLQSSDKVLQKNKLDSSYVSLFEKLVLTTAWQESCWRQYVAQNKRIEPLRSGSGDVGLMQVNERVWRGIYDIQKLRWDVDYNTSAGAEILYNYLTRYAIKKGEHRQSGGLVNLARSTYSAYNGGPSAVSRYRRSDVPADHRKIDRLFWEKYQQVDAGQAMNVARCLGGTPPSASARAVKPAVPRAAAPEPVRPATASSVSGGSNWLRAQPATNYTLQLASFSTRDAAETFIREQSLTGRAHVTTVKSLYVVLFGSFSSRDAADPHKRKFQKLKPWLRQFQDLRG